MTRVLAVVVKNTKIVAGKMNSLGAYFDSKAFNDKRYFV